MLYCDHAHALESELFFGIYPHSIERFAAFEGVLLGADVHVANL